MTEAATSRMIDDLGSRVASLRWHHSIDLGHGIITPGQENTRRKLARLKIPDSLAGKTVLDIGAWDGFFSFEAERRGAARVLATDSYCWSSTHEWAGKAGFDLAKAALGSQVDEMLIDVLDLSPSRVGLFDVVLFLGVLYHMKHPLLALERVASVAKDMVIVETVVDMLDRPSPSMNATSWRRMRPTGAGRTRPRSSACCAPPGSAASRWFRPSGRGGSGWPVRLSRPHSADSRSGAWLGPIASWFTPRSDGRPRPDDTRPVCRGPCGRA